MEELKLRIKQLRLMLNLSMADFASSINVSPGNVGDWESLKRKSVPSASALKNIAEKFDVSLDWLLFGTDREHVYSETIIGRYTANSIIYEKLISIALVLPEDELLKLLEYAEQLKSQKNSNRNIVNRN